MRILAIESSTSRPTLAIAKCPMEISADHSAVLASLFAVTGSDGKNDPNFQLIATGEIGHRDDGLSAMPFADTSRRLVPQIQGLLDEAHWIPQDIELVVASRGPGSFTGVRIGLVAAKSFCFATGCSIVGVDVLPALAVAARSRLTPQQADRQRLTIAAAIDAGRGEILAGTYHCEDWRFHCREQPRIHQGDAWLASLPQPSVIIGSGIRHLNAEAIDQAGHLVVDEAFPLPDALTIAKVGVAQFLHQGGDDVWKLNPIYARPSAAEEAMNRKSISSAPSAGRPR